METLAGFLNRETDPNDPIILQRALIVAQESILSYIDLKDYLSHPENRGRRSCLWCQEEFSPMTNWMITCSDSCQELLQQFPPVYVNRAVVETAHSCLKHLEMERS